MSDRCPLLFQFRDKIYGSDFAAEVVTRGRVLGAEESESFWMYGVLPGGLAQLPQFRGVENGKSGICGKSRHYTEAV